MLGAILQKLNHMAYLSFDLIWLVEIAYHLDIAAMPPTQVAGTLGNNVYMGLCMCIPLLLYVRILILESPNASDNDSNRGNQSA